MLLYYVDICVARVVKRLRMCLIYQFISGFFQTNIYNVTNKEMPSGVYTFSFIFENSMV